MQGIQNRSGLRYMAKAVAGDGNDEMLHVVQSEVGSVVVLRCLRKDSGNSVLQPNMKCPGSYDSCGVTDLGRRRNNLSFECCVWNFCVAAPANPASRSEPSNSAKCGLKELSCRIRIRSWSESKEAE